MESDKIGKCLQNNFSIHCRIFGVDWKVKEVESHLKTSEADIYVECLRSEKMSVLTNIIQLAGKLNIFRTVMT
jgi:hypothetical protein